MSLAVLTDSTTAQDSPALNFFPGSGNSTNTTSVSSCCAWSVMPTVASTPDTRTHSCDFAYFRSLGMFDMRQLSQGLDLRSIRFSVNRFGHNHGRSAFSADFNLKRRRRCGTLWRYIAHADANA